MPSKVLVLLLLLGTAVFSAAAQSDYAATITVINRGLSIQRANTVRPLSLPQDSVAIVGVGDVITTDRTGRALVTFADSAELLLMPDSRLEIVVFERTDAGVVRLETTLEGHAIQRTAAGTLDYTLRLGTVAVTPQHGLAAMWSSFEQTPVITIAEGSAAVSMDPEDDSGGDARDRGVTLAAGEGFLDGRAIPLATPLNAARLVAQERGCAGTVKTTGTDVLNLRAGPGLGYTVIGYYTNTSAARLMAVNQNTTWYRVQRFSGFGWVQALAVESTCTELPRFPLLYLETNAEVFEVRAFELDFMRPFYGDPEENIWFYRSILPAESP